MTGTGGAAAYEHLCALSGTDHVDWPLGRAEAVAARQAEWPDPRPRWRRALDGTWLGRVLDHLKSQEVPIALTAIPAFGALYAFVVHGAVVVGGLLVAATLALVWAFDGFRG